MDDHEPTAAVLRASRAAGLAPYDTLRRLRVSRLAQVYSHLVHLALGIITLSSNVVVLADSADFGNIELLTVVNIVLLETALWGAVIGGPHRLRTAAYVFTHVKKVCRAVKYNPIAVQDQRKTHRRFILLVSMASLSMFLTILTKVSNLRLDGAPGSIIYQVLAFNINSYLVLLLIMQFVLLSSTVNSGARAVCGGLRRLGAGYRPGCRSLPQPGFCEKEKNAKYDFTAPKEIISTVQFINVKPRMLATFDHGAAHESLRSLACAYVSTCDLVKKLDDVAGGLLFQLVSFCIFNLLRGIYFSALFSGSLNTLNLSDTCMFCKAAVDCCLHFIEIIVLVAPCNDLSEELENIRFLVSYISCEAASCSKAFRAELYVFFIHLKINQPCYTALGVFALGRPLFITVVAVVVTYLAVFLEF